MFRLRLPFAVILGVAFSSSVAAAQPAAPAPAAAPSPGIAPAASHSEPSAAATSASGPSEAMKAEAASRFERAIKLYEEADYALALAEFERVYELVPDYRVLYNIGQVSMQLSRYARALRTLQEYLERGGDELSSERVAAVRSDLEQLAQRTASITLRVEPPGAEVSVDGHVVGTAPLENPFVLDVGVRRVEVRLEGYTPQTLNIRLAGGDRRESTVVLQTEPKRAAPVVALPARTATRPTPAPPVREARSSWVWAGWASTGALAAGAAVAGGLGIAAKNDLNELRATGGVSRQQLEDAQSKAKSRLLMADVLGAAALAVGGVTLYFQLSTPKRGERPGQAAVGVQLTPRQLALTLTH